MLITNVNSNQQSGSLSQAQIDSLNKASQKGIETAFGRVQEHLTKQTWLDAKNPFLVNTTNKLKNLHPTQYGDLAEYIAASAPAHCIEGWAYLGRAVDCQMRGDYNTAVHLAYYSQLRAAMSLLATQGIGIFDNQHFVVNSSGVAEPFGDSKISTHTVTWLALQKWFDPTSTNAPELLGRIIKPENIQLEDWIKGFNSGTLAAINVSWLKDWGLDLARLSKGADRNARNEVSYRPALHKLNQEDMLESSNFISTFWRLCEPSITSFNTLDTYLLKNSLSFLSNGLQLTDAKFRQKIIQLLKTLPINSSQTQRFNNFLLNKTESRLIVEARGTKDIGDKGQHLQVVARAILLLRLATGTCEELMKTIGVGSKELRFWWKELGEERGLWKPDEEPLYMADLWSDIEIALDEIELWQTNKQSQPGTVSLKLWRSELTPYLASLGECERIGLWGLTE